MARTGRPRIPLLDRFYSRLPQPLDDGQCWEWQGRLDRVDQLF